MDRIELLRVFTRVAACSSFSQAADTMNLSRASVSAAVQQLESRLGTRLLQRTTRRVTLTADGEALLDRAAALIADLDELEQQFRPSGGAVTGRLRVDLPSRIARRLAAPALPGLLARHPGLRIELGSTDRAVDLVHEGIDAALRVGPLADSSLVARPFGRFALLNCASPAYLARHGVPASPEALADGHVVVDYVSPTSGRAAPWEWVDAEGRVHTRALPSQAGANNAETYIALALAGLGLIQVPAFDVREQLAEGTLVEVMPVHRPAPMPVQLVVAHRRQLASRRLQVFGDWLAALLAPALADG